MVQLGIPGLILALGFTMTGYLNFWLGFLLITSAAFFFAVDAWPVLKSRSRKLLGIAAVLIVYALICWGIFVPAPLDVLLATLPGSYAAGTDVGSIKWDPAFLPIEIHLNNKTGLDYTNLNAYIRTNGMIDKISIAGGINRCIARPWLPVEIAGATISTKDKAGNTTSIPIFRDDQTVESTLYQIQCDKLVARFNDFE